MTKKHFIAFAKQIKGDFEACKPIDYQEARSRAISRADLICKIASQFNSNFDEFRFRAACGLAQ